MINKTKMVMFVISSSPTRWQIGKIHFCWCSRSYFYCRPPSFYQFRYLLGLVLCRILGQASDSTQSFMSSVFMCMFFDCFAFWIIKLQIPLQGWYEFVLFHWNYAIVHCNLFSCSSIWLVIQFVFKSLQIE